MTSRDQSPGAPPPDDEDTTTNTSETGARERGAGSPERSVDQPEPETVAEAPEESAPKASEEPRNNAGEQSSGGMQVPGAAQPTADEAAKPASSGKAPANQSTTKKERAAAARRERARAAAASKIEAAKAGGSPSDSKATGSSGDSPRKVSAKDSLQDLFTLGVEGLPGIEGLGDLESVVGDEVSRLVAERDEYLSALQRLKADFDNSRKRALRQQAETQERANEGLIMKLLPVLDALDLAMVHASEAGNDDAKSVVQIGTLLRDTLAREGLTRIDTVNSAFDPSIHDAVAHDPRGDDDSNKSGPTVSNILRPGYSLKGRVIRPAMVMVRG